RIALVGQHEAVGGPLEKRMAHGVLERAQPPPHCRLRLTELPGRGAESALARHCQEDSEIAPLRLGNPLPPNRFAWTLCSIFDFHAGWKWPSCGCRARSIAMMSTATMQAAVLEHHAAPFRFASVSRPVPGPGQALVRIAASAVNPLDIKIRAGAA